MSMVTVFDTTLRDGEPSPGASMTPAEKLRMAHQHEALGVDVIEAGFPISSPDDFKAVQTVGREVRRPVIIKSGNGIRAPAVWIASPWRSYPFHGGLRVQPNARGVSKKSAEPATGTAETRDDRKTSRL